MKRVVMICPSSSQPRLHKRADQLKLFSDLKVYAFRREVYEENSFSPDVNYTSLGYLKNKRYLFRLVKILRAVIRVRLDDNQGALFYAMSIDCLLIARLAGLKKGFYEVGDLRAVGPGKIGFLVVERLLLRGIKKIIITSKYFYAGYYKGLGYEEDKFLVVENKLSNEHFPKSKPEKSAPMANKIRIGLIGLFRYKRPITLLINFIKTYSDLYTLECYGDGPLKNMLMDECSSSIRFYGSFKYPDDLKKIYENIDINFIVYDVSSKNVTLALPNKLYESLYFSVPIVCSAGTALESEVVSLGVGQGVSIESQHVFNKGMLEMDKDRILGLSQCASLVSVDGIFDSPEGRLRDAVMDVQ